MLVFICYVEDMGSYMVMDEYGTPVCARWFRDYVSAEDYCIDQDYVIGELEEI